MDEQRRITFLDENQGCWTCITLADGDDPPVWCDGDFGDDEGEPNQGQKQVCESLSRFLVTFVLQELTLGSRYCLSDEGLSKQFEAAKDRVVALWENGPYVHGSNASFFLWNGVLVANLWGSYFFGANHETAIQFLQENQGPIVGIGMMVHMRWRLDIGQDGSATIAFQEWPVEEEAKAPMGTFDFENLKVQLSAMTTSSGHPDKNCVVFFQRRGQSYSEGQYLPDHQFDFELFKQALEKMSPKNSELKRLFREKWLD